MIRRCLNGETHMSKPHAVSYTHLMLVDDLDQVMEIEQDLFHVPWTKEGFFTFLTRDDAMFLVVEEKEKIQMCIRDSNYSHNHHCHRNAGHSIQ